ncbi:hypothetical protein, partial [Nostoc sp.]
AVDYCAERLGITRAELMDRASALTVATAPTKLQNQTPTISTAPKVLLVQDSATTVLQTQSSQTSLDTLEEAAISIIDNLVLSADKQTLGGCVIIAAPGAGKTTFLGTAWGRLKTHHGNRLQSLAVVVKKSDLAFFKSFATTALCIKDNPVNAVVEIIKFIDAGMKEGKITRLFLDDFLTMNVMLENALKGIYLEPNSYYISEKKELGFVPLAGHLQASLNEAWLVGREYNLCLWVSSHSPNLDALPFCGSRDSRSVGDIIFLAKNSKREFLELALNNAHLISNSNKRQELKQQLDQLDAGDSPIVLSNNSNWTLGVVPEFIRDEYKGYRSQCLESADFVKDAVADDNIQDDTRQQLESFFKLPSAYTPALSKVAATILDIIRNGNPPVKLETIRKSRKWGDKTPPMAEIKSGIDELIQKELIDGKSENGFTVLG